MSLFTLDWSQISYVISPLIVPWWAEVNIFVGFVLLYWIVVPILYYTNVSGSWCLVKVAPVTSGLTPSLFLSYPKTWNFAYMPISTDTNCDRYGQPYNVTLVIDSSVHLNETAYQEYSPLFMSTSYAMVYALSFCLSTAAIVHTLLYYGKDILRKFKNARTEMEDDVHAKLMRYYPEVPNWWYATVFSVFFALSIVTIEVCRVASSVACQVQSGHERLGVHKETHNSSPYTDLRYWIAGVGSPACVADPCRVHSAGRIYLCSDIPTCEWCCSAIFFHLRLPVNIS